MLLNEFINFSNTTNEISHDRRYDNKNDREVVKHDDKRKVRLTLGQINKIRMATESHEAEKDAELEFIRQMYGQPPSEAAS